MHNSSLDFWRLQIAGIRISIISTQHPNFPRSDSVSKLPPYLPPTIPSQGSDERGQREEGLEGLKQCFTKSVIP